MNKEQYVSYEIAKLLKEKGFCEENVYCYYQGDYKNDSTDIWRGECKFNWNIYDDSYSAPTQQMAMSWLEETYSFFIEISRSIDLNGNYHYFYMILDKTCKYVSSASKDNNYSSKSDAVEAALEYILTKLI